MPRIDIEGHGTLDTDAIAFIQEPEWGHHGWSIEITLKQRETPIVLNFGKVKFPKDLDEKINTRALELYFEHGGIVTDQSPTLSYDNHERGLYTAAKADARKEFQKEADACASELEQGVLAVFNSIRKSVGTTFARRAGN